MSGSVGQAIRFGNLHSASSYGLSAQLRFHCDVEICESSIQITVKKNFLNNARTRSKTFMNRTGKELLDESRKTGERSEERENGCISILTET